MEEMIPSYLIEQMDSEWKKAAAYTENFMQTIKDAPFSEHIKEMMIAALKCNIELLKENEKLRREIEHGPCVPIGKLLKGRKK
jgi:hypothetical protein